MNRIAIKIAVSAIVLLVSALPLRAASGAPVYIVNGERVDQIGALPTELIERVEMLPADENSIALYGEDASNGVILVTLIYDTPARFDAAESFADYIASQVKWSDNEPTARIVFRYKILNDGTTEVTEELESTDNRFKRRVLKAISEAPRWTPALKEGQPVETVGVLHLQLPEGRSLPRSVELVIR